MLPSGRKLSAQLCHSFIFFLIVSQVNNYNQVLAQEEGVTAARIKQILKAKLGEPLQDAKDSGSLLGQLQRASQGEKKSQR